MNQINLKQLHEKLCNSFTKTKSVKYGLNLKLMSGI